MRIAVCDDLKNEREKIIEALYSVIDDFFVDEFSDGKTLLTSHVLEPYDLIILDILMPGTNGIDIAAELRKSDMKTPIIFVSVSEEFGVQSYRVLAFDYLLKPIEKEQLENCVKRLLAQRKKEKSCLTVFYSGVEVDILLSNIQYLESNLRKVLFTLADNRVIEISGKLADYEPYLTQHGFCRCHKSYLVNIEHIDRIEDEMFCLTGGDKIKISRAYMQSAKKAYFEYIFKV